MATTRIKMELIGTEDVKYQLGKVSPEQANYIMRSTIKKLADIAAGRMMVRVKHRTGRLAKTIKARQLRSEFGVHTSEVRVGHNAPYGLILEWGSRDTKAQPYIIPTVEELKAQLPEYFREEFGKKLERALRKNARKANA